MDAIMKKFIEEQNEKLATMVAQGFASVNKELSGLHSDVQGIREILDTKADKSDIECLEGLLNSAMGRRMEDTDRLADRTQRLEMRVTHIEAIAAR